MFKFTRLLLARQKNRLARRNVLPDSSSTPIKPPKISKNDLASDIMDQIFNIRSPTPNKKKDAGAEELINEDQDSIIDQSTKENETVVAKKAPKPTFPTIPPKERESLSKSVQNLFDCTETIDSAIMEDPNKDYVEQTEDPNSNWFVGQAFNVPENESELAQKQQEGEEFTPKWLKNANSINQSALDIDQVVNQPTGSITTPQVLLENIVKLLEEERGNNITSIDVRHKTESLDYIVIVEGRSTKHIYSMADTIKRYARNHVKLGGTFLPDSLSVEGAETSDWMVLDMGSIILHCFLPEARELYNLEEIWSGKEFPKDVLVENEYEFENLELAGESK